MRSTADLPGVVRAMVEDAREAILRSPTKPRLLVLFGSQARGEATSESDIDLLVVVEREEPATTEEIRRAVYQVMSHHDFARLISVRIFPRARYEDQKRRGFSFVQNVERDGVVLWRAA